MPTALFEMITTSWHIGDSQAEMEAFLMRLIEVRWLPFLKRNGAYIKESECLVAAKEKRSANIYASSR